MKKIRAAVVGYGNIGKYTLQALEAAGDFEVTTLRRTIAASATSSPANCPTSPL